MAIVYKGSASGTTSATIPTHAVGDLILVFAYRDGNVTAPTMPGTFTQIGSPGSANTNSERCGYRIATSTSETTGTWTNATSLIVMVYSGASIGTTVTGGGASTTINYPALTPSFVDNSSWIVAFAGHRSVNTNLQTAPGAMVNRATLVDATDEVAAHDTNGGVTSWASTNVAAGGTSSGYRTRLVELVDVDNLPSTTNFDFTLTETQKTGAVVYNLSTNTLVRTLWGNRTYNAGTHNESWDGYDDLGANPGAGPFKIIVYHHSIGYEWLGAIGNTSDDKYGINKYAQLDGLQDMAIVGTKAFFPLGFCEASIGIARFNTTNPQSKIPVITPENGDNGFAAFHVTTDGTLIYWGAWDPWGWYWPDGNPYPDTNSEAVSVVYATNVSNDAKYTFSAGTTVKPSLSVEDFSCTGVVTSATSTDLSGILSGLTVQTSGIHLYVCHGGQNTIRVWNKTTGAFIRNINTFINPRRAFIDSNGKFWVIASTNNVTRHTINGDGTLSAAELTINPTQPLAITVSPDGTTLLVVDGGASQQVKAYNASTGASVWTLGQAGGYTTNGPAVEDDKFMFDHPVLNDHDFPDTFVAFDPADDSFWVGDGGNVRVMHFDASRNLIEFIRSHKLHYSASINKKNGLRIFSEWCEFEGYPDNWTLINNWAGLFSSAYLDFQGLPSWKMFKDTTILSNNRTYSTIRKEGLEETMIIELDPTTGIRETGVTFPSFYPCSMLENGDVITLAGEFVTNGIPVEFYKHTLTGFDGSNNPIYSAPVLITQFAHDGVSPSKDLYSQPNLTDDGRQLITFDTNWNRPVGSFHIGGLKVSDGTYQWRAARSNDRAYAGDYPDDGTFDCGNGVEYAGAQAVTKKSNVIFNYRGEFWKLSQVNKFHHYHVNGVLLSIFGTTGPEAGVLDGPWSPRYMAGSVESLSLGEYNGNFILVTNDESYHGGSGVWEISNLNSLQEQSVIVNSTYSIDIEPAAVTFTTNDLTLSVSNDSPTLTITTNTSTFTANDVTLTYNPNYMLDLDTVSLTFAANDVSIVYNPAYYLDIDTLNLSVTANPLGLELDTAQGITLDTATITITSNDLNVIYDLAQSITLDTVSLTVTPNDLDMVYNLNDGITLNTANITMSTNPVDLAVVENNIVLNISTATITISSNDMVLTIRNSSSGGGGSNRHRFNIFSFFGGRKF